jgi:hypothetical protein
MPLAQVPEGNVANASVFHVAGSRVSTPLSGAGAFGIGGAPYETATVPSGRSAKLQLVGAVATACLPEPSTVHIVVVPSIASVPQTKRDWSGRLTTLSKNWPGVKVASSSVAVAFGNAFVSVEEHPAKTPNNPKNGASKGRPP